MMAFMLLKTVGDPQTASQDHIESFLDQFSEIFRDEVQACDAKSAARLETIPFEYYPSIAAHSGSLLPRNPTAWRLCVASCKADYDDFLGPITWSFFLPSKAFSKICCALAVKNCHHLANNYTPLGRKRSLILWLVL